MVLMARMAELVLEEPQKIGKFVFIV
jgi:hypothetical protein